ncbi:MAG TPA: DUF2512 family protein [Firmicutes bacterium]|nr:DUF2512 family protein [Bacillota bacterium]
MNHESAFFSKLIYIECVELVLLMSTGATFAQAFSVGMVTAAVIYVLGDLLILPSTGNLLSIIIDGALAFLMNLSACLYTDMDGVAIPIALAVAAAVMLFESISHRYMLKQLKWS